MTFAGTAHMTEEDLFVLFSKRNGLGRYFGIALAMAFGPWAARAANVTIQGTIGSDDAVAVFNFTLAIDSSVDIRSYGYAGGTTSTGTVIPNGGFDSVLTLFDSSGGFLLDNDEGAGVAIGPTTGLAADARVTANLAAGNYFLAITQYDNFALGLNLSDGFVETGNHNFTADPAFTSGDPCPGGMFRDISGTPGRCRTGNWAVDFVNVESVSKVPEPKAILLVCLGLAALLIRWRYRSANNGTACCIAIGLIAMSAQGQTQNGPDYTKVSDFLNGQRTLLQITDLTVISYEERFGWMWVTPITTSNSQQATQPSYKYITYGASAPILSFAARMFNTSYTDTLFTVHNSQLHTGEHAFEVWSAHDGPLWEPLGSNDTPLATSGVAADFTLDGFDDLVVAFEDGRIAVATAINVNDNTAGLRQNVIELPEGSPDAVKAMAAGDFNGDGKRELATLLADEDTGGIHLWIFAIDPNTLAMAAVVAVDLNTPGATPDNPVTHFSVAAGRFNSSTHDQLVVAFSTDAGPASVEIIDFDLETFAPTEGPQAIRSPGVPISAGFIQVTTGKFALPNSPYHQIAYFSASPAGGGKFLEILSVNPTNLAIQGNAVVDYGEFPCGHGINVGNFDNRQPDPLNPGQTQYNPNNQIAMFFGACDSGTKNINIYSVDPNNFSLIYVNGNALPPLNDDSNPIRISLVANDMQGRSLTLGEPMVINVSSTVQPSVVVGVPPMHVDFISPDPLNKVPPQVKNLSAVPEGFKTTFEQDDSTGNKSSTTSRSSWSFGVTETLSGSLTVGDPDADGVKDSDTLTAAQKLKGYSENVHGAFQGQSFNLSTTTGFGDEVSYLDSPYTIWVYPVIGKTVCPAANPNCPPSEQVPLTVQFSAPSGNPTIQPAEGGALQWYQPPWEPGNIFSYPGNIQQLLQIYPDLQILTNEGITFLTDTSTLSQKTTWSVTTKDTGTTSSNQNYSFENDFSVNGSVGLKGAITGSAGFDLDMSGSFGFSKLAKNTASLGLSTGLQISKPGTFADFANFGYWVTPYIMGTTQPGGVVDSQPLSSDVQTFGAIRAMFVADPLKDGAGAWWQQAYGQAPDVALNHPLRWSIDTPGLANPIPSNCLATGTGASQMDCATLRDRIPDNPWLSHFHQMRGFFISSAAFPGQGPRLEYAKADTKLTLQTRVYNYSLYNYQQNPLPTDTQVHVRFYFTPWNGTVPAGNSVLIGETKLDPIPSFSNVGTTPNWVLASTTFDPSQFAETKCGNVSIVFWVVAWMQTPDGKLVGEMPGHGLTSVPGTLNSLADAASLEECQTDGNCYSNNVGFYKQIFYLDPPSSTAGCPVSAAPSAEVTALDIGKVQLSAGKILRGRSVVISASLLASGAPASGVSANFYHGDPKADGRLVTVDRIPHITPNVPHNVQMLYRPSTCGVHQFFVVVNQGKPTEVVRRAPPLRVSCEASPR